MLSGQLVFEPSGPRMREAIRYDLPLVWPLDYARTVGLFKFASREERLRFLTRVGTRFVVFPTPPFEGARPLARLMAAEQLQLYDFNPAARRVYIVPDALLGPDVMWQIEGMFQARSIVQRRPRQRAAATAGRHARNAFARHPPSSSRTV